MFKLSTLLFAVFLGVNLTAQVVLDMKLSGTSSDYKIIPHDANSSLPETITVKGYIVNHKKGICGDICAGGTIQLELSEKVEGYPHSYMYIVTGCTTGKTNPEIISLLVTKFTGEEKECYYKDVVEILTLRLFLITKHHLWKQKKPL